MLPTHTIPAALIGCLLLAGCGAGAAGAGSGAAGPTHSSAPAAPSSAPPTASLASDYSCATRTGGDAASMAQLTAVRTAHHPGFDQITFQYAAPVTGGALARVPAYTVSSRSTAAFSRDASGQTVALEGSAGLLIVARGTSAWDNLATPARQTYTGGVDLKPQLPSLRELAVVGDFERVLSWGAGLSSTACFRVTELSNPARLVVEIAAA